jgi:hypothetical protein
MEGSRVLMRFDDHKWYHGVVSKCRTTRRTCTVDFDDGDCQTHVSFDDPGPHSPLAFAAELNELSENVCWNGRCIAYWQQVT